MDVIEQARTRRRLRRLVADGSVKRIRSAAGVSQEAMAQELGCGRDTLIAWEAGQREPRAITDVVAWLRVLDGLAAIDQEDDQAALAAAGA